MAKESWEERKKNKKEIKELLKSSDNKRWYHKKWRNQAWACIGVFIAIWQMPELVGISIPTKIGTPMIIIAVLIIIGITRNINRKAIKEYLHKKVETERPGCTVEIRVADSYLTNAFQNYPKSAMMIGVNKAFWFQESEPNSLVADLWKTLDKFEIGKEDVQEKIDVALERLKAKEQKEVETGIRKPEDMSIDSNRPQVYVRKTVKVQAGGNVDDEADYVLRDNYKVGTIIGVDLCWTEPKKIVQVPLYEILPGAFASSWEHFKYTVSKVVNWFLLGKEHSLKVKEPERFWKYLKNHRAKEVDEKQNLRKLYMIANSEIIQGKDTSEPMKVNSDKNAPVAENFEKIWEFFEKKEKLTENPPENVLYAPLLLPLIGGGVANEGYTDLEIFSQLIDLYYKHLRRSIRLGEAPAIPQMIINIRNKTAIEIDSKQRTEERKIDIETAFWYLDYKNQVNPPARLYKENCEYNQNAIDNQNDITVSNRNYKI